MKLKSAIYFPLNIIVLSILVTSCLVNDSNSPEPSELFVKYYGGEATESIQDIAYISSSDEYIVVANSNSDDNFGANLNDIYVFKTDNEGTIQDEIYIDYSSGLDTANDVVSRVKLLDDNSMILIGTTQLFDNQIGILNEKFTYYLTLGEDLVPVNSVRDTLSINNTDVEGNDIIRTSDGNYVILSTVGNALSGERNLMYTKVSPETGEILWRRINNIPGDEKGVSLLELPNGDIAICAQTERVSVRGYSGINVLYLVLNPLGFIKNSLSYGTATANSIIVDDIPAKMVPDGLGAVIVGSSISNEEENPFILPVTSSGAISNMTVLRINDELNEGETLDARFNDVRRTRNGDYIVTGDFVNFTRSTNLQEGGSKRQEALFVRTNQFGTEILSFNNFGDNFDETGKAITELSDGKVLIGATIGFGGSNTKIGLIKANRNGRLLK